MALVAVALAMEAVLLLGWLRPLSLWRHSVNPPDGTPMVTILGRTRGGALQFAVPAALLIVLYVAAVWLALRAHGRLATAVTLLAPVVFAATLVPVFPGGTQDIFHNVADARLLWRYGENPTVVPPIAHPDDPFYRYLFGYVDLTSAYGPLWYALAGIPTTLAGDGMAANLVAQKAMMALFLVGTVGIVWAAARRAGAHPPAAAVVVGWCPLLLWEFAANGHNDIIMVFFAAGAVAAALRRWWLWVFPLLALSALVKFTTALLGPVLLVWLLRRDDVPRRTLAAGLTLAAAITVAAYVPFWAGTRTFAVLSRPGMTFILSPATLLDGALAGPLGEPAATRLTQAVTALIFLALYALALARAGRRPGSLAASGFDGLLAYLVFASWWFWPWYLSWLAPLAAWRTGRRVWVFAVITAAGLLSYLYWWADPPERSHEWFVLYVLLTAAMFALPFGLWAGMRNADERGGDG